jgi:hypothetical protein
MSFSVNSASIKYGTLGWEKTLVSNYRKWGVAVINNIYTPQECNRLLDSIVTSFEKLGSGIDRNDPTTWEAYNTPAQTRYGMFQALMCHLPAVWEIRTNPKVKEIFDALYSSLKNNTTHEYVSSIDGINVLPNGSPHLHKGGKPGEINPNDWPHIDQTIRNDIFKCVQGQSVLADTTAGFVCSPGSHHLHNQILDLWGIADNNLSNWCKFDLKDVRTQTTKDMIEESGGVWQVPIIVPRGSFIVWSSTLVHSAKLPDHHEVRNPLSPFDGWRGVVYVSYRPREEYTDAHYERVIRYIRENRVMNHWNAVAFPKKPGGRWAATVKRHPKIEMYHENPTFVYLCLGLDPEEYVVKFRNI